MGRKILFFDIDGTLVDTRDRSVPASAVEAIHRARQAGHLAFINSGRPWCGIDPRVKALDFDGYACGCGLYIRVGDQILCHRRLEKDAQLSIVELVRAQGLQCMFEGAEQVYFDLTRPLEPHVEAELAYYTGMGLTPGGDPAEADADFDKFVVWEREGADMEAFRRGVSPWFDIIDREGTLLEMVPRGCSKGTAMELLLERYGLTKADCVAVGDGVNDLPMLDSAGISVAMGNGDPRIFSRVTWVTSGIREDGIARALEKFHII